MSNMAIMISMITSKFAAIPIYKMSAETSTKPFKGPIPVLIEKNPISSIASLTFPVTTSVIVLISEY